MYAKHIGVFQQALNSLPAATSKFAIVGGTIIIFGLNSCIDYGVDNTYTVANNLHQPVKVRFEANSDTLKTITIGALTNENVFIESGLCGKNYVPPKGDLPFKTFDVYYKDTIKIKKYFINKDIWSFTNRKYEGKYILVIDATMLK